jgi:hypothetical protein
MAGTLTKSQLDFQHKWIHIWFEQGRGRGGVPKVVVHTFENETLEDILRKAVALMRCASQSKVTGHNKDLMPGKGFRGYEFHQMEGGIVEKVDQIDYVQREDKNKVACLILCWGLPSEHLMRTIRKV